MTQPPDSQVPVDPPHPSQPEPRKKRSALQIVSLVLTIAVLAFGAYLLFKRFSQAAALTAGQCIVVTGSDSDNLDHTSADCSDASTYSYYVATVTDGAADCADGVAYALTSGSGEDTSTDRTACLVPQFAEGVCYTIVDDSVASYAVAKDCDGADFKVDSVVNSSNGSCVSPAVAWSFTTPARTYCIEILS